MMPQKGFRMPSFSSRASKYGYSNARAKAMRGLILKPSSLDEMIRVGNVEAMAELMQRTSYKSEISAASVSYRGSQLIEMATSRNFSALAKKLVKITPESDKDAIRALLARWDLLNIKTLINARRLGKSFEEIRPYLFDVGGLDEDDFRALLKADNNSLAKEIWKTRIGKKMRTTGGKIGMEIREASSKTGPDAAARMEGIIDTFLYMFMDKTLEQVGGKEIDAIRQTLRSEADAKNVMIIERLKKHNASADKIRKCLIRGGTIPEQMIAKLIDAKDLSATLSLLRHKFPRMEVKGEGISLPELEAALDRSIASQKAHAFARSILSVGVVLGLLLLKEEEVNNLRKIAKGKEFRMSESDVRATLVVV